jgi:hypothetical protein
MTDISGIHQKSIHIYQYDYPYPSSTLFPVIHDYYHNNNILDASDIATSDSEGIPSYYFNKLIHDIHTIMLGNVPTMFEFPIDFIPDVSIPSLYTCEISTSVIDISGSGPILHIVDTTTDISGNQIICDISASVVDISGSEPILNVDITDTCGNQIICDISASNVEYDTSGILQSSTYTIDCSSNSIQVTLSDFGNNLPPYVVYICDVCAKAKLSTP